jgi:hypothetical protein
MHGDVLKEELYKQLDDLHETFDMQIRAVDKIANKMGIESTSLKQQNGDFVITPLLLGLAQVLNAKVYLVTHKNFMEGH